MQLDKFIKCSCGKKKKINWIDKLEFTRGETTFCIGITECPKCKMVQQHYCGNYIDIQNFINELRAYQVLKNM